MEALNVHADCEIQPLPLTSTSPDGTITDIGLLRNGTGRGSPSFALVITLEDGTTVLGQTTWALMYTTMIALAASPIATGK